MQSLFLTLALAAGITAAAPVRDMAGRNLSMTLPVKSVYSTSPVGEVYMYTLAPELVCGISWTLRPRETAWLLPSYARLPVLGGWMGKSASANLEEIVRRKPGMILSIGSLDGQARSQADRLQRQLGRPVVMGSWTFAEIPATYRFLGNLLGRKVRADSLAARSQQILDEVARLRARGAGKPVPRVYYAEGLRGLETDPSGSAHAEPLGMVGALNVAHVPMESGFGRTAVSFEQLLSWDPDWILVGEDHTDPSAPGTLTRLKADPHWKLLRAVRTGHIVRIPDLPFNWFDRPPAPSRLLGLLWLEALLHPDQMPKAHFQSEMRSFFRQFYHRSLTPSEEATLLKDAFPEAAH